MTLFYSNMTVSLCIRQESERNDDSVSVEELDWSAERQVLIPAEHLWCDFKYRPWAKNSSPNTNDMCTVISYTSKLLQQRSKYNKLQQIKLGWALFVTYTIIQSIMRSEMCSLHLTHPSVHTWSSGQPTVQRPGSSRGLPVGAGIWTHNLGLPRVSSPMLYPLGQRLPFILYIN